MFRKLRSRFTFAIPLLAGLAFVIGAIRLGGLSADKLWSALLLVVVMVLGLAVLAGLTVMVFKGLKRVLQKKS